MSIFDSIGKIATDAFNDATSNPVDFIAHGGVIGSALNHMMDQPPGDHRFIPRNVEMITEADQIAPITWHQYIKTGLGDIFRHYDETRDRYPFIPPLYGVAYPGVKDFNAPAPFQLPDFRNHMNGPLTKIVVHYLEDHGVPGLQQYFGHVAGEYIGTRGNFKEVEFKIPLSDRLQRISVVYLNAGGIVCAIRFRTRGGLDSGWIGHRALKDAVVFDYECPVRSPAPDGRLDFYPILAFDGFTNERGYIQSISVRFTYPYQIITTEKNKVTDDKQDSVKAEPLWVRTWKYKNDTDLAQDVMLSDRATVRTSHTVKHSDTDSSSTTTSLSIGASAMIEGITLSANETTSSTVSHTSTTSDSVTAEQVTTKYFDFPLKIPPHSTIEATVEVGERKHAEKVSGKIQWEIPENSVPPMEFSFIYKGTEDLDLSIELNQVTGLTK